VASRLGHAAWGGVHKYGSLLVASCDYWRKQVPTTGTCLRLRLSTHTCCDRLAAYASFKPPAMSAARFLS